jgi:hypothetical protein
VLVRGETHGMEQDPRKGQLAMYAATRTYEEVRYDPGQSKEDLLSPISTEEAAPLILRYKDSMNPRSTIYTCASCGIRVILPEIQQPYQLPIRQLVKLKLSPHQIETFKNPNFSLIVNFYIYKCWNFKIDNDYPKQNI